MSLITKAINKLPSTKKKSPSPDNTVAGRKKSDPNAIPPEPVQQQPQGNFRHQEQGPALSTLNFARANKRAGALVWDNHLADDAQGWADKLASSRGGGVSTNGAGLNGDGAVNGDGNALTAETSWPDKVQDGETMHEQGQCVSVHKLDSDDAEPTYEDAVKEWLKQETKYDGGVIEDGSAEYKGYTQCMWSDSKHIGIAKSKASNGTWYVVARFTPPGNIMGQRPFEVRQGGI